MKKSNMTIAYHYGIPVYDVTIPNENWTIANIMRDALSKLPDVQSVACDMVHPSSESNTIKLQIRLHRPDIAGVRTCITDACSMYTTINTSFAKLCSEKIK
jgi:DNA-directed RNA polymerase subunit L